MGNQKIRRKRPPLRKVGDREFAIEIGKNALPWIVLAAIVLACGAYAGGRYHFSSLELASQGDPIGAAQARGSSRIFITTSVAAILGLTFLYMTMLSRSFREAVREVYAARIDRMATKKVLAIKRELEREMATEADTELPKGCEFIIALVTKTSDREVVLGDSAERFAKDLGRHGRRRALILQFRDIAAALPASVWTSVVKAVKWLVIGTAIERIFFR